MKTSTIEATHLTADPGHVFTQSADVPLADRIFTTDLYLAASDSPDAWREITADEAAPLRAAQAEERERRLQQEKESTPDRQTPATDE
ncbi:MAG: hypothetical protein NC418_11850 [Muribaculaceae bacterium]|nr:hypothetical protein [Muribaculaceae bacterium]